jgi:hypothetical protein
MSRTDQLEHGNSSPMQLLKIHTSDNIAVAVMPLRSGQQVTAGDVTFLVTQDVLLGAKIALCPIPSGKKIIKYGEPIGSATVAIQPGEYVHTHNLCSDYLPTPRTPVRED